MSPELQAKLMAAYPDLFGGKADNTPYALFGIECGDGWYAILDELCAAITALPGPLKPKVMQIKEKFGGLRFYLNGYSPSISPLVDAAERKSERTCEQCGKPGSRRDNGWVATLCDEHAKERP